MQQDDSPKLFTERLVTERLFTDLETPELVEQAILRREGALSAEGALVIPPAPRGACQRFIVDEPSTTDAIAWDEGNRPCTLEQFDALWDGVHGHLRQGERFVAHLHVGEDPEHYIPVKVTCETAWHCLFARHLLIPPARYNPSAKEQWKLLHAPTFDGAPPGEGLVIIHFARRKLVIAGQVAAGELHRALLAVQSFLLPEKGILPLEGIASIGDDGDVALFIGAPGSGRRTLAAGPGRSLVGATGLGWGRDGLFNLAGGCERPLLALPPRGAAPGFGTLVENGELDEGRRLDRSAAARCAFPVDQLGCERAGEPRHILLLCRDPAGVLPPVAILDGESAADHFLAGYGARAGLAEEGEGKPGARFAPGFGAIWLPRSARVYADLLARRIEDGDSRVFVLNTGWIGGPAGNGGEPVPLEVSRAIVAAILQGALDGGEGTPLAELNLVLPRAVPGLDNRYLDPANGWRDPAAHRAAARALAEALGANLARFARGESPGAPARQRV